METDSKIPEEVRRYSPSKSSQRVFNFIFGAAVTGILVGSVSMLVYFPEWKPILTWTLSAAFCIGVLAAIFGDEFLKGIGTFLGYLSNNE